MCRSLSLAEHTKNKVVIMVIVMVSLFLIFNISESIILLSILFETSVPVATVYFVTCCSSSVNAVVYGIFNDKYREKLSQILCMVGQAIPKDCFFICSKIVFSYLFDEEICSKVSNTKGGSNIWVGWNFFIKFDDKRVGSKTVGKIS